MPYKKFSTLLASKYNYPEEEDIEEIFIRNIHWQPID